MSRRSHLAIQRFDTLLLMASAILAVGLVLVPVQATASSPVLIDSFGVWSLEKLGYPDQEISLAGAPTATGVRYLLPTTASQGPDTWYVAHIHFKATFAEDSGDGFAYVTASTNDHAVVQVEFDVARREGGLQITWRTLDFIDGTGQAVSRGPVVEGSDANYLQFGGVRPDENQLTFQVAQYDGAKVSGVEILKDSGIERTPLAPAELHLDVTTADQTIRVGDTFRLGFKVTNAGGRAANRVAVKAAYPTDALQSMDPATKDVGSLQAGNVEQRTGRFAFRRSSPGTTLSPSRERVVPITPVLLSGCISAEEGPPHGLGSQITRPSWQVLPPWLCGQL